MLFKRRMETNRDVRDADWNGGFGGLGSWSVSFGDTRSKFVGVVRSS